MIRNIFIITFLGSLSLPFNAYCQKEEKSDSVKTKAAKTLPMKVKVKYADALFLAGNYYDAIKEYGEIVEMKPDNGLALYRMGESYFKARDYENAEKWFAKVIEAGADASFPFVFYHLATVQKMNGKYEEAKYSFARFALRAEGDYITRAKREIDACDFAKGTADSTGSFKVAHLDSAVNSPFAEYAPAVDNGRLYYASLRQNAAADEEAKTLSHVYVSEKGSAAWKKGMMWTTPFNSQEFHTGNVAFSPDGQRAYFTQCSDNGEASIRCMILMSAKDGNNWLLPVPLNIQTKEDNFTYTHPAVAAENDLDVVYFSSDRTGGAGGLDLWFTEVKRDGSASEPVNLGPAVNTIDDEVTPLYHRKILYFSSNGHIGFGGLDVFVSSGMKNGWSKPKNLGNPLNSSADDFYFTKGEAAKIYYFVSNRAGVYSLKSPTCCDDIFMAQDFGIPTYTMKARVFEKGDTALLPLTGARVEIFDISGGGKSVLLDKVLAGDHEFSYDMTEGKNYEAKIQKKGYFTQTIQILSKDNPESEYIAKDITLEKLEKKKSYKLDKIYYESNKSSLTEDSKASIQALHELLAENPKLVVEISAHTDDAGTDQYNLTLSQERAESVVDYLVYLGIEAKRLIAKGYGESSPVASNNTEEGKQANRRTEFKIVGELSRVGDKVIFD